MALNIHSQTVSRLVTARAILLQTFHHQPVEIAPKEINESWRVNVAIFRNVRQGNRVHRAQAGRRLGWFILANLAAHFIHARRQQFLRIKRRVAGE